MSFRIVLNTYRIVLFYIYLSLNSFVGVCMCVLYYTFDFLSFLITHIH